MSDVYLLLSFLLVLRLYLMARMLIFIIRQVYPKVTNSTVHKGLLGWFLRVILIRVLLYSLGSGEASLLDVVAYAGYGFAGTSLAMLVRIFWGLLYYFVLPWFCICTVVFLVKTMNRVLLGTPRS